MEGYGHSKLRILGQVCYCGHYCLRGLSPCAMVNINEDEARRSSKVLIHTQDSQRIKKMMYVVTCNMTLVISSHGGPQTGRIPALCTMVSVEDDVDVHDSRYFHGSVRLNYNSIKGRLRVGTAAMVLCAIPLDARMIILCGTEAPRVWTLARFRRWWCIEGCNLRLLEDCSELIVLKVLLSHGFLSLIGPTLRL